MQVLRISHSAVVSAWRERERELLRRGVAVKLISAKVWTEGGRAVRFGAGADRFADAAATVGRHPNIFLFDPRPVWRALRTGHFDVIDVHEEPCSLATAEVLALRRLSGVRAPVVLYSAQNIEKKYPPPFRWFEGRALQVAAGVSVCNSEAGSILRRKGLRGTAAEIPLGVDLSMFAAGAVRTAGPGLHVGYVGRLERHKGVHVLIDALAHVPAATLTIAGAGPAEADLRERARSTGVRERVTFRSAVDSGELAAIYRTFDVLAVPSLPTARWMEQFGRVVVEAMACGVPVIASRSGALPDVVGGAGVLVPPGDVPAWSQALAELAGSHERRVELREAGLRRAERFTWSAVAAEMAALYHRVSGSDIDSGRQLEVVVIAYGAPEKLERALAALDGRFPITVVDNSSSPKAEAVVQRHGGRYLDPGRNLGFAAGVNHALTHRSRPGADVLLLNPDAEIGAGAVDQLHGVLAADPATACVGPAQVGLDGAPDRVLWPFPTPSRAWLGAVGLGRVGFGDKFLIGSVLLIRGEALADVGEFDERFFLYAEETDWQRRARARGWRVRLVPEVLAVHEGAGTSSDPAWRTQQFLASLELYVRKHFGDPGWRAFRLAEIVGAAGRSVLSADVRRRRAARERLGIYLHGPVRLNRVSARPGGTE